MSEVGTVHNFGGTMALDQGRPKPVGTCGCPPLGDRDVRSAVIPVSFVAYKRSQKCIKASVQLTATYLLRELTGIHLVKNGIAFDEI